MDANEMMWAHAAADEDAERNQRAYSVAKVAAQQVAWPFLAAAESPEEYAARFELVADRIAEAVGEVSPADTALLDQVTASLREDHGLLLNASLRALAAAWADEDGPLHAYATAGVIEADLHEELGALYLLASAEEQPELERLITATGGSLPFAEAVVLDPDEVADGYENPDALRAGYDDGYYGDNAGVEQHGNHPDYARGMELGQEAADDERQNPQYYREPTDIDAYSAKTADGHGPYYIREEGGKYKVVNSLGEVKKSYDNKADARNYQQALFANVPGAQQKGEEHHGKPVPEKVRDKGRKASKTAMPQRWSHWDGNALYDHDGNKLGHVAPVQEGSGWHAAVPAGHTGRLSVIGTHPTVEDAKRHVESEVNKTRAAAKTAKDISQEVRDRSADDGHALSDGSFPINSRQDGEDAKHDIGRTNHDRQTVIDHINRWADTYGYPKVGEEKTSARQYGYLQDGVFHAVAVNEDAYGADRYEHVSAPATPSWINDQLTDGNVVQLGDTPVENNADGDELKPTAPWLVREEVRTRTYAHPAGVSLTVEADAENPFVYTGPGNPGNPPAPVNGTDMPSPIADDSQIGVMPDAGLPPDTSMGTPDQTNPSLSDLPAADGSNLDSLPSSGGDDTSTDLPSPTSARYTVPVDSLIDRIASQVMAANPGMSLRTCVRLAERTVHAHPELVRV